MVGALRQAGINGDQILHLADLGRKNDRRAGKADLFGQVGGKQCRLDDRFAHHLARRQGRAALLVVIHQPGQQRLVERAPVHADAHRLFVADRRFDDRGKLPVLLFAKADIARIDPVLVERFRAGRMIGQQLVADIVEIADQRHIDIPGRKLFADVRHGGSGLVPVHRYAHQFRSGGGKRCHLLHRGADIGRIGIGHGLHHDRRIATADDIPDWYRNRLLSGQGMGQIAVDHGLNAGQDCKITRTESLIGTDRDSCHTRRIIGMIWPESGLARQVFTHMAEPRTNYNEQQRSNRHRQRGAHSRGHLQRIIRQCSRP